MRLKSTKFILSVIFSVTTIIFTAVGKLSGSEFITAMTLIIGVYSTADVTDKRLMKGD